jgi:hypothetical protein
MCPLWIASQIQLVHQIGCRRSTHGLADAVAAAVVDKHEQTWASVHSPHLQEVWGRKAGSHRAQFDSTSLEMFGHWRVPPPEQSEQ